MTISSASRQRIRQFSVDHPKLLGDLVQQGLKGEEAAVRALSDHAGISMEEARQAILEQSNHQLFALGACKETATLLATADHATTPLLGTTNGGVKGVPANRTVAHLGGFRNVDLPDTSTRAETVAPADPLLAPEHAVILTRLHEAGAPWMAGPEEKKQWAELMDCALREHARHQDLGPVLLAIGQILDAGGLKVNWGQGRASPETVTLSAGGGTATFTHDGLDVTAPDVQPKDANQAPTTVQKRAQLSTETVEDRLGMLAYRVYPSKLSRGERKALRQALVDAGATGIPNNIGMHQIHARQFQEAWKQELKQHGLAKLPEWMLASSNFAGIWTTERTTGWTERDKDKELFVFKLKEGSLFFDPRNPAHQEVYCQWREKVPEEPGDWFKVMHGAAERTMAEAIPGNFSAPTDSRFYTDLGVAGVVEPDAFHRGFRPYVLLNPHAIESVAIQGQTTLAAYHPTHRASWQRTQANRVHAHRELHRLLRAAQANPDAIIDYVASRFPETRLAHAQKGRATPGETRSVYDLPAHLNDRSTIRDHTRDVLTNCNEQLVHLGVDQRDMPRGVDLRRTLRLAVTLHDVGKGVAVLERGSGVEQHRYTLPIMSKVMFSAGLTPAEICLANALVNNDILGSVAQRKCSVDEAYAEFIRQAHRSGLNPSDFFKLQNFFYTIDATSYANLAKSAFRRNAVGLYTTRSPELHELAARFGVTFPAS